MTRSWSRLAAGWNGFFFRPRSTASVEVLRIVFGLVATAWMASLVPVLVPFFGPRAAVPPPQLAAPAWTLFTLVHGTPAVWAFWAVGLIGALALTVGYRTRLAALIVFVVMVSVSRQAPVAFNAGDALLRVLSFYVLLMPAGSAASVDRWLRDPDGVWDFPRRAPWALRLAQIQLSVIYLATVWEKAGGALWRDGSAVSYALRIGDVTRVPAPAFVTDSVVLTQLATHGTLALELAIGVLVWNRAARPWVLGLGVLLHVSIEFSLAVGFFGLAMLTLYLAFLSPGCAERALLAVRDRVTRGRADGGAGDADTGAVPEPGTTSTASEHDAPTTEAGRR